jgi:tetratricopeptide (TPR) repeat protein
LAIFHRDLGQFGESEAEWQKVIAEQPKFVRGWLGLAELYLAQKRWPELSELADRMLKALPEASPEANTLKAQALLGRKQFRSARAILEQTITAAPQAISPRITLTHVLLQEGQDLAKAEQALRDLLALDPGNMQAKRNLEALLQHRQLAAG